ncbi:MAG: hypothetical protein ACK4OO_01080 [bacterium]
MSSPNPPEAPSLDGWETRYIGSSPRLEELEEFYKELGFEVQRVPFDINQCNECCKDCFGNSLTPVFVLYTRRR